jgi:hypothetical protein
MTAIARVRLNDDGTLQMPTDDIVAALDEAAGRVVDRIGLLPRRRPPAAVMKSISAVAAGGVNANRLLSAVDPVRLMGFAFRETAGAVASLELRAGTDVTGDLAIGVNLAANGNAREWFGPNGLAVPGGLFLVRLAGSIDGSVWLGEI